MKIRHALPFVAAAALLVGLSPVASGAPKKDQPGTTKPQAKPTPPPNTPPAGPGFSVVDGFMNSMNVNAAGEITEISVTLIGSAANAPVFRVMGCGLKQLDNPVLLMAFEYHQRVRINVADGTNCYMGALIGSPKK